MRFLELGDDLAFCQPPEPEPDVTSVMCNIQVSGSYAQNLPALCGNDFDSIRRSFV
jgi:hypothetical protein